MTKSWATSLVVHASALSALVGWQGAAPERPWLDSRFGQTSLMLSAADPNPGSVDDNNSLAEPSIVLTEPNETSLPLPAPAIELEQEVDETTVAPETQLADVKRDDELSLLPPEAALEPIEKPSQTESIKPPPGDDTPTSSVPSPGRVGNEQPTDPSFDSNPPILYPPAAVRDGVEGTVILRIRIGADGGVVGVELVESSGSSILDRAAIEGVGGWHGRPAQLAGRAIEAAALLPVVFRIH